MRSVLRPAFQHAGQDEANHRGRADRDRRAFLDEVARRSGQLLEVLLVERRGESGDGRRGRARIVAILLAELVVDGAGAVLQHLGEATDGLGRSEEHTSELQSLMRISYAVFCLKKKKTQQQKKM